jgi:aryl-phospho-beta-D-glucosidase BglC (GH1 family)/fibronectin type 3 domain-containing protein
MYSFKLESCGRESRPIAALRSFILLLAALLVVPVSKTRMLENINKLKCFIAAIACLALPSVGSAAQVMPTPGFNLGNTLESTWGYTPPTQALINSISAAGFKTLRVPCAWNFNSTNGTINAAFMTQVVNVVNWALATNMYVIINDHWDDGWFETNGFNAYDPNLNSELINMWTQIGNQFKSYDSNKLAFACANEPQAGSQTQVTVLYQYYQNWINAMRASGGNNAVRWLVVQAGSPWDWSVLLNYGTNLPADSAMKLMIEEHTYDPGSFTTQSSDESWGNMTYFWGSAYHVSGTLANRNCSSTLEESYIQAQFTKLQVAFENKGYPVLIGEWAGQPKPAESDLTGSYINQNVASVTYYDKFMENTISSFGFSGTFFTGQGDMFDTTTGTVNNQTKLNAVLGISALPPIPGLATPLMKLTGVVIGSPGSWSNLGNTITNAFDGNTNTFYDAANATGDWAGLDLGSGTNGVVMQIQYCPRVGWAGRMVGGQFQGANVANFSSGVTTLFTVASTPPEGTMTVQALTNASSFRYLRYIGPANAFCDVAEVEFDASYVVAPTSLVATASNAVVSLSWNGSAGATSYNVKRSTTSGSGYTNIASGVTATSYLDTGLANGTTYYYVVAATNNFGVSADSAEASATPLGPVSPPWQTQDIGAVGIAGSSLYAAGVFTVSGAGADIQGSVDAFRFDYMTVTGDCTIIARVASVQNIDPWSKAGVMIRASLDPGATNALIAMTPGNGVTWQYRLTAGGGTSWNQTSGLSAPYWVKLVRSGTLFTGFRSPDGTTWTQQGSMTNSMVSTVYAGLALTSHNISSLGTATFDNVTVQPGWPVAPAAPAGLTATAGDGSVALNWSASATATNYFVKRSTVSGSGYSAVATNTSLAFTDTGLSNGTLYYYVVSALNGAGESTNSTEVSARPTSSASVVMNSANAVGQLQISWPADHTGWQLQSQTNNVTSGLGTNWVSVPASMQTNQMTVPLNSTNGSVFFRLVRPY